MSLFLSKSESSRLRKTDSGWPHISHFNIVALLCPLPVRKKGDVKLGHLEKTLIEVSGGRGPEQ